MLSTRGRNRVVGLVFLTKIKMVTTLAQAPICFELWLPLSFKTSKLTLIFKTSKLTLSFKTSLLREGFHDLKKCFVLLPNQHGTSQSTPLQGPTSSLELVPFSNRCGTPTVAHRLVSTPFGNREKADTSSGVWL